MAEMGAQLAWEKLRTGIIFNPQSKRLRDDPHPYYRELRERDPVHRSGIVDGVVLTRYDDALQVLSDRAFSAEDRNWRRWDRIVRLMAGRGIPDPYQTDPSMLRLDPPHHTRLRGLVSQAFTPRAIDRLRPRIEALAEELLDAQPASGTIDLVEALAVPLPVVVIAELLGVPAEDQDRFRAWSEHVAMSLGDDSPETIRLSQRATEELSAYLGEIADQRRVEPREDLISDLVAVEEEGDRLTKGEMLGVCVLLLVAGNETTTKLIGNGIVALLRNREQLEILQGEPKRIEAAVEETLRYDGTVQYTSRFATEDTEIGGHELAAGRQAIVILAAANRDPARFVEPDRFDVTRDDNRHLAFSHGTHFCLGARLARLETSVAFEALIARYPNLDFADAPVRWSPNTILRGPEALPLSLAGRTGRG